jgi:hypothetical protein
MSARCFKYLSAVFLVTPILLLYFLRVVRATDVDIDVINMTFTFFILDGYLLWL